MPDFEIRTLGEDDWQLYRDVWLAALQEAPQSFVARHQDEQSLAEDVWRERMTRARRFVAQQGDDPVGVVSLGLHNADDEAGEVYGLWIAPSMRGAHVARDLVGVAARQAAADGRRVLFFWAGSEDARAIGFATNIGFRPTSERRPVPTGTDPDKPEAEVAMVLPLLDDPTTTKNPYLG